MGSTHLSLHFHLIFGTKDHEPLMARSGVPGCTPTWAEF